MTLPAGLSHEVGQNHIFVTITKKTNSASLQTANGTCVCKALASFLYRWLVKANASSDTAVLLGTISSAREQISLLSLARDHSCECNNNKPLFQTGKTHPGSDVSNKGRTSPSSRGQNGAASPQPPRARGCSRPWPSRRPGRHRQGGPRALPQGREGGREGRTERGRSGGAGRGGRTRRRSNPVPPPHGPPGARRATAAARAGPGGASAAAAMGWEERQVRGYPEFVRTAQSYHGRPIFALFCGDKDAEGRSWCPDCVTGEAHRGSALPGAWAVSALRRLGRPRVPLREMPGGHSSPRAGARLQAQFPLVS